MASYTSNHTGEEIDLSVDQAHTHSNKAVLDQITSVPAEVPTKTSQLTNDSGYLTLATLPKYGGESE